MDQKSTLRNRVSYKFFSQLLYQYISTPSGLSEVVLLIMWILRCFLLLRNDSQEKARLASKENGEK
jgi:hypothetical protein